MKPKKILFTISALAVGLLPAKAEFFLVGDATEAGWNENLPEELTSIGYNCYLWDGRLGVGEFKFLGARGDWNSSWCAPEANLMFESGKVYGLTYPAADGKPDYKFYNETAGYCRIVIDMDKYTVRIKRPALLMVGPAANGWDLSRVIPVFADDEGNIAWEGMLAGGEVKFLTGNDWQPCYNAPFDGDQLGAGGHQLCFQTGEYDGSGNYVDHKFIVPREGYYYLDFNISSIGADGAISVRIADEPTGAFGAPSDGRYLVGIDRAASRMHFAVVPQSLYLGTSASDAVELESVGNGSFSADVELNAGSYYKLASDRSNWELTAISPSIDTDITTSTANASPMHGYSYTVPATGTYTVTADFSGNTPSITAVRKVASAVSGVEKSNIGVRIDGRDIVATGDFNSVAVYDLCGGIVGTTERTTVSPGIYVVKIDEVIYKIVIR